METIVAKLSKKEQRLQMARERLGIETPAAFKEKKKRKPMTEAQKAKARENLAKARAARGPAKSSSVHPQVAALPEDHPLSEAKVKSWLKYQTRKGTHSDFCQIMAGFHANRGSTCGSLIPC